MEYVNEKMFEVFVFQELRLVDEMLLIVILIVLEFKDMVMKCRFVGEIVVGF